MNNLDLLAPYGVQAAKLEELDRVGRVSRLVG